MSPTLWLLVGLTAWCAIGIVVSIWMRRRGHALFMWAYLGAVLGPLVVPLALDAIARERSESVTDVGVLPPEPGKVNVLVGIDGSEESFAAARSVVALLDQRSGRLTLAAVIDFDSADGPSEARRAAVRHLSDVATDISLDRAEQAILVGVPADALEHASRDGGFDLLVVGRRGRGASRALLGSVAVRLASSADVSVLIGRRPMDRPASHLA
jgi:nucleotide-binding universal stress UspA family protein